jgi:hypothetical protein
MNSRKEPDLNQALDRLLRNASAARQAAPSEMPFAVEARVMAAWRQSRGGVSDFAAGLRLLRYGLGIACAVALVAVSLTWSGNQSEPDDIYAISNATANLALLQ